MFNLHLFTFLNAQRTSTYMPACPAGKYTCPLNSMKIYMLFTKIFQGVELSLDYTQISPKTFYK